MRLGLDVTCDETFTLASFAARGLGDVYKRQERIAVGPSREREVLAVACDRLQEVFAKRYPFVGKNRI